MMHWGVYTPTYTSWSYDWYEPPESTCDWVAVEADTKKQALVEGVRKLRAINSHWMQDQESDNANPFTKLKVESLLCPHGICCYCDLPEDECDIQYDKVTCPECEAQWDAEVKEQEERDRVQSSS